VEINSSAHCGENMQLCTQQRTYEYGIVKDTYSES